VEDVKQKIDPRWAKVRTRLETMEANFVPYDGYRTICSEEGVTDAQEQDALATILNCLGIALNYRDDPRLRDTSVLKPQWLVDGIYGVLRWMQKHQTNGIVQKSDLAKALPKRTLYPLDMHGYLLDLMAKFELSFELDAAGGKCLVPGLLSPNQPVELKRFMDPKTRRVQFRYSELRPPGLVPQFIVRSHTLSEQGPRWQRGVVLKRGNAEVLVRADAAQLVTDVYALGEPEDRVWLTEYVYAEMRQLNGRLPVKTFVESETQPGVWSEWETLRADTLANVKERTETRDGGATVTVSPAAMLCAVESNEATAAGGDEPLPLFVCYTRKDKKLVDELIPTLKVLANRGYIRAWRDTDLIPGEDWDETIKTRLMEAEIVLYMVTTKFMASEYIRTQERPISMAQRDAGKADVLPVLLRACDCTGPDFPKLQWLPHEERTLDSYHPHDGGWMLVQRGIQKAVERRRGNRGPARSAKP
jgi:internalin A